MSKILTQKYGIEGMHCSSCALNIEMDLEELAGIREASVSYARQEATVSFEAGSLTAEDIVEQIKESGYSAKILDPDAS